MTIALSGPELRRCKSRPGSARRLLADSRGQLRVAGRYAEGTSSNGRWLTEDRCTATRMSVTRGSVALRDTVRKRTATVRKGRSHTVRGR